MSTYPAIAVLDYGMGNLRSVTKAFESRGGAVEVVSEPSGLDRFDGCVLPGVGAFPRAMNQISASGLDRAILDFAKSGRPLLGICLGLQLLFDSSEELGGAAGLGLLPGRVLALDTGGLKLPHIGWAEVEWTEKSPLIGGIPSGEAFYFVHSYIVDSEPGAAIGVARYGKEFVCVVGRGNVFGVQFHPEKSSDAGLALISNFVGLCSGQGA